VERAIRNTGCVEINNGLIGCRKGYMLIGDMMKEIAVWWSTFRLNSRSYQDGLGGGGGDYDVGQKEERQTTRTRGTIDTLKMILQSEIIVASVG